MDLRLRLDSLFLPTYFTIQLIFVTIYLRSSYFTKTEIFLLKVLYIKVKVN